MGVREDGAVVGSVSGGCVEPAVMQSSLASLSSHQPIMLDFGSISDESVWEVGLSCGGRIRIWVQPEPYLSLVWSEAMDRIANDLPTVLVSNLRLVSELDLSQTGEGVQWICDSAHFNESQTFKHEGQEHFAQIFPSREKLVIVGAVHIAIPLIKFARELGFETILIDPRAVLASSERFPVPPDLTVVSWPEDALKQVNLTERTYAVVLTHDPKIDDVALEFLLRSPVAYIGALGSRVTQEKRRLQLSERGFPSQEIARIHGPVGLKIGGRSPEEIALSIMAEIVQVRNARR